MFSLMILAPSWVQGIPLGETIYDFIDVTVKEFMDKWIEYVANAATNLTGIEQLIGGIVLALILISGMIGLVKVVSKIAIVAAIIFAIWLLFQNNVF